jgi:hypothetical protein
LKWKDAALNIATVGYHSYRKSLKLESELKSLRDNTASGGGPYNSAQGAIGVISAKQTQPQFPRKQNVQLWRGYSQYSVWVRTCIDIYRNTISQAEWQIVPVDEEKDMDKGVVKEIEMLLNHPNRKGKPYSQVTEEFIEDYLVIGHGVILKKIRNDLAPLELDSFDAALFAFNEQWDGDQSKARYACYSPDYKTISKYIPDPMAMVMVNRSTSYDILGCSNVETLDTAVRALLASDDYLREQVLNPSPNGVLNLGRGIGQGQVDETRRQMDTVKRPFVIVGGTENVSYTGFAASESQIRALETSEWFVRQCCANFNLPTAMVGLAVDTSRANTDSMLGFADTGLGYVLKKKRDLENMEIVQRFGPMEKHNCAIAYPILNQRDETAQAGINQKALANVGWRTINEVRKSFGDEPLKNPFADEILVPVSGGAPVPLSMLQMQYAEQAKHQQDQEKQQAKSYRKLPVG